MLADFVNTIIQHAKPDRRLPASIRMPGEFILADADGQILKAYEDHRTQNQAVDSVHDLALLARGHENGAIYIRARTATLEHDTGQIEERRSFTTYVAELTEQALELQNTVLQFTQAEFVMWVRQNKDALHKGAELLACAQTVKWRSQQDSHGTVGVSNANYGEDTLRQVQSASGSLDEFDTIRLRVQLLTDPVLPVPFDAKYLLQVDQTDKRFSLHRARGTGDAMQQAIRSAIREYLLEALPQGDPTSPIIVYGEESERHEV